jgi:hypothetical protein
LNVAPHFRDQRNARLNVADELAFHGIQIFAYGLEDLRQIG